MENNTQPIDLSNLVIDSTCTVRLGNPEFGENPLDLYLQTDEDDMKIGTVALDPIYALPKNTEVSPALGSLRNAEKGSALEVWNGRFWQTVPKDIPAEKVCVMRRVNLKGFLQSQDGKFVGAVFVKADGTRRHLNGRLGVTYPLGVNAEENAERKSSDMTRPYITIYCMSAHNYREMNLETVYSLRAQGHLYVFEN